MPASIARLPFGWFLVLALALALVGGVAPPAWAQVVLDGTTGPAGALAGPDYAIPAGLGRRAGTNLFHSFERFSLATGERATFSGPDGIANVISRVTGGERSAIDGTLRSTIPGADLWFLNPAGAMFGPNARLDVQGSFRVSTADELGFEDGARFSAADPAASRFTVAAPEAFGFLGAAPAGLLIDRSRLSVPAGEALSLVGGDITVTAGNNGLASGGGDGTVRAEAGRITLAALGGPGAVRVADGAVSAGSTADIRLSDQALVDVSGDGGGTVRVRGGRFVVENQSFVFADNTGAADARGGVTIEAEAVTVGSGSAVTSDALDAGHAGRLAIRAGEVLVTAGGRAESLTAGAGDAGLVAIDAGAIEVRDGGAILGSTLGGGRAGRIALAADRVLITRRGAAGETGVFARAAAGSTGDAGAIAIGAADVEVGDGGLISATSLGGGDAGAVVLRAGRLRVAGDGGRRLTGIASDAARGSTGRGGRIAVAAEAVELRDAGIIRSDTAGPARGGVVTIDADRLFVDGTGSPASPHVSASALPDSTGDAGAVVVTAKEVELRAGGFIASDTRGAGRGGRVAVEADRLRVVGAGRDAFTGLASLAAAGTGDAGSIRVVAAEVEIRSGGVVASSSFGAGDAGTVRIEADRLLVDGEGVGATGVSSLAIGDGGDAGRIAVHAERAELRGGGVINTTTFGRGRGGTVEVRAGRLLIDGEARPLFTGVSSSVETGASGRGGALTVAAAAVELRGGGQIRSLTFGPGDAGSIAIIAERLLASGGSAPGEGSFSGILSSAEPGATGGGGAVRVGADLIELGDGAEIRLSSDGPGSAGDVLVVGDTLRMDGGLITTAARVAGGGRIDLTFDELIDLRESAIVSTVAGDVTTTAGDITIDPRFLVLDRSAILARAGEGRGGNIAITVGTLFRTPDSVIDASAQAGIDGTVEIRGPDEAVSGGLAVLPGAFVDASALLRESCAARRSEAVSSLTASGRGGLPAGPDAPLPGFYTLSRDIPVGGAVIRSPRPPAAAAAARAGVEPSCGGLR